MRNLIVSAALLSVSMGAYAQQPIGPYIGVLGGSTDLSLEVDEDYTYKTDLFTWGAMAGWQITPHFAVEAGYLKPKSVRETVGEDSVSGRFHAWTATAVLSWPLSERWSVHARAGGIVATEKYSAVIDGLNYSYSDDTSEITYGAGISAMVDGARLRLEYQRADFDYGKVGIISLAINWFLPTGR
jgi:hypothetical protein